MLILSLSLIIIRFLETTTETEDGFPNYKRPDNHRTCSKRVHNRDIEVDNRWVVPYNPHLLGKYDCHINVEICSSVKAVKYLYKYITKGVDRGAAVIEEDDNQQNNDEIQNYIDCRYVCAPEACWRIFEFPLHQNSHTIIRLPVHVENGHLVLFNEDENLPDVIGRDQNTMLTSYFNCCQTDINACQYTYSEFPEHYIFNKTWKPRQRGGSKTIGRMYSVSPNEGERYYLRLLLVHVRGPKSFEDIRTVDGTQKVIILIFFRNPLSNI